MICAICGKEFSATRYNSKYCCDFCARQASIEISRRWRNSRRRRKSDIEKIHSKSSLDEKIKQANEHGISYGDFIALSNFGKSFHDLKYF